jgi:hypothetical protein
MAARQSANRLLSRLAPVRIRVGKNHHPGLVASALFFFCFKN